MKAIVFYLTVVLTVLLLSMEVCLAWIILAMVDAILIAWCHNNIGIKEASKYSGYSTWYKFLKNS